MSSSNSPCAACKFLRRKCTQECVLAPYFPPDQPQRFVNIHKVFGNSNVTKILNELPVSQREDAVNSLAYEAESRLSDPVYGCVGLISYLQQTLKKLQIELESYKNQLASYTGGQTGIGPMLHNMYLHQHSLGGGDGQFQHPNNFSGTPTSFGGGSAGMQPPNPNYVLQYNMAQMMGIPSKGQMAGRISGLEMREENQQQEIHQHNQSNGGQLMMKESNMFFIENKQHQNPNLDDDHHKDNILAAQQLITEMQVKEEHELMRNLEQHHQTSPDLNYEQQSEQFLTFSGNGGGFHDSGPGGLMIGGSNSDHSSGITVGGGRSFGHMVNNNSSHVVDMPPSLALGTGFDTGNSYHFTHQGNQEQQQQQHDQAPLMLLQSMDSHHNSPDLELNRSVAIPQQFFQEEPGTTGGGGFGESRNNSSTATSC